MSVRPSLAALALAAVLLAAPAAAARRSCAGKLSGAVQATFRCDVALVPSPEGKSVFTIVPTQPVSGVPSCAPGAFELPDPVTPGTYTLATLGMGRASVAAEGGTLYTATKTTGQRGEVTLRLDRVARRSDRAGGYALAGTYRARLVPAGAGKSGEVVIEVTF